MSGFKRENECKTYVAIFADERYLDDIAGEISQFIPCNRGDTCISIGENEDFNVDVNVMIRRTIKELLGREELLLSIQQKYCAEIYLEVVPWIVANSDEPRQILSLEEDIIKFLYIAGVRRNNPHH